MSTRKTMYRVSSYSTEITPITVVGETEKFVTVESVWAGRIKTRREAKESSDTRLFDDLSDAIRFVTERTERNISGLLECLAQAQEDLERLRSLAFREDPS